VNVDLSRDWRFEEEWQDRVDDVRARLDILPLEAITLG
jgi:hypothetical protein